MRRVCYDWAAGGQRGGVNIDAQRDGTVGGDKIVSLMMNFTDAQQYDVHGLAGSARDSRLPPHGAGADCEGGTLSSQCRLITQFQHQKLISEFTSSCAVG
jgi:hypothetical protein